MWSLRHQDRTVMLLAVIMILSFFSVQSAAAEAQPGAALFQQNCSSCHSVEQAAKVPVGEAKKRRGMSLWFAGSKFKQEWLETWLPAPAPIFGVTWGTLTKGAYAHPAVEAAAVPDLVAYLMTLVDPEVRAGVTEPLPKSRGKRKSMLGRTRQLFEKHQGCYACHQYTNRLGKTLGGFSGPSLVGAAQSLNPDWVAAYLHNPRRYYPNGTCPIPGDSAFNKFSDQNRAALATYISNMGER